MTTLVLNYSTNLLEGLFVSLKNFLMRVMIGWQTARQLSANERIAYMLKHEYPKMSVPQIRDHLNRKTVEFYGKEND